MTNEVLSLDRHQNQQGFVLLHSLFFLLSSSYEVVPHLMCSLFKYHSFSANLEKHALVLLLQLKARIKEGLGFFFSRVGGEKPCQRHPVIFSIPDFDISFMVCLFSEERRFLYAKCHLLQMQSASLKHSRGNFMIC